MKLTTAELVYLNEAAKAFKRKDFILVKNMMIGVDNIKDVLSYIILDSNFIKCYAVGALINTRALSAFVKTISLESEFEFNLGDTIKTVAGGELNIGYDHSILSLAMNKIQIAQNIDTYNCSPEVQSDVIRDKIYNMNKSSGGLITDFNGKLITIFPSILPITKADKLFMTLYSKPNENIFVVKFRIDKKKFNMITYIAYIDLYHGN